MQHKKKPARIDQAKRAKRNRRLIDGHTQRAVIGIVTALNRAAVIGLAESAVIELKKTRPDIRIVVRAEETIRDTIANLDRSKSHAGKLAVAVSRAIKSADLPELPVSSSQIAARGMAKSMKDGEKAQEQIERLKQIFQGELDRIEQAKKSRGL